ncbi:MAG: ligase-associated DNA damage response DEXH box helicase [Bdellovibrionales bacterium]|nr:ligase-associated DNA damage response DEXH box helicase [Bdellovibrionales bacterium]
MEADRSAGINKIRAWFKKRRWRPFPYQEQAWRAYAQGKSGLISVPTGYGKTLAATLGAVGEALLEPPAGMFLLYISPLKALTRDLSQSLQIVLQEMGADFKVECRTGDTSASAKARQLKKTPAILFTTPESLSLMLSYPGAEKMFGGLRAVIVDEWHELIASKRGVQTQLGLSRLKAIRPELRIWGLSATLGNLQEAAESLAGKGAQLIRAHLPKEIELDPIYPKQLDSFPWAGHLGLKLLPQLVEKLSPHKSTLIFTNTRSQAERWHGALQATLPEMADRIAIHHSAVDREDREMVEDGLRSGEIKWVVCTSSLDLGVDFQKVEQCVQIGSAKSLARLVQRAGRSRHRPGEPSHLLYLPTNSWELVELEAARHALDEGVIEPRRPLRKPMDVLVQHLVTLACGDGFRAEMFEEVRAAHSYRTLSQEEWDWTVQFIRYGGTSLKAYPQYQKIFLDEDGVFRIRNTMMARQHRMSIGTITSSQQLSLHLANRKRIGSIEESFVSKLKRGDVFYFTGRRLEFMFLKDMKAYVRVSKKESVSTPSWAGTQLPLSESLSGYFRHQLAQPPTPQIKPLLEAQERLSHRPREDELLIEQWDARDGRYLYVYPFGGRSVHEGLAALWTYRLGIQVKATFSFSVNDYGVQIVGPKQFPYYELITPGFFSTTHLEEQITRTLNMTEMALRRFRGVAQTAGLVFSGYPSARKNGRQMQISSSLLFEVFRKHDPESLLFKQAQEEVLFQQLEIERLRRTLERLQTLRPVWVETSRPSPLALPIWAEMNAAHLTTETLAERMERMKKEWSQWT